MLTAIKRNGALFTGMAACAILGGLTASALVSGRGATGPTVLGAHAPVKAVLTVVGFVAVATVIAGFVGRVTNAVVGLFVLGTGLYGLAGRLHTVEELAWAGRLGPLPVEALLWGVLLLGATLAVFRIAGDLTDLEPSEDGREPHWATSGPALRAAAAFLVMIPIVWLLSRSTMKGQMIGTVFVGAMGAGLLARLLSPGVQPKLLFALPCLAGAVGYLVGQLMLGGSVTAAVVAGDLPALLRPMPPDYAAGGLMGVAMGLGWAKGFLHQEPEGVARPA